MQTQILKLKDVIDLTKLSGSTIYRLVKIGQFPRPIKLATHASGWLESEIDDWILERKDASVKLK
jgi:prophage regulatory protein